MKHNHESLLILRHAGEQPDHKIDLAETALALASFEKQGASLEPYRQHLDMLVAHVRAAGTPTRVDEQLAVLRRVLVIQNKYQGKSLHNDGTGTTNLMDVIDQRSGTPLTLGIIYLHVAHALGWAMTGLDLSGHFLLRLSGHDGQVVLDPFRAGQTCQIEEATDAFFDENGEWSDLEDSETQPMDLNSELLRPLSAREILLQLQHAVKNCHLSQNQTDAAISTLQGMILFAPRKQDLWKELGYLQADRGQLRAAISALEVVKDLEADSTPLQQTDIIIRELRWRLN